MHHFAARIAHDLMLHNVGLGYWRYGKGAYDEPRAQ
jgi:hypothetical protein